MMAILGRFFRPALFVAFVLLALAFLAVGVASHAHPYTWILKQDIPQCAFAGIQVFEGRYHLELNWLTESRVPKPARRSRNRLSNNWILYRDRTVTTNCWGMDFKPMIATFGQVCLMKPLEEVGHLARLTRNVQIAAHFTIPTALAALYPVGCAIVYLLRRWNRRRRVRLGLCVHCAYDLRGATADRCTECGTPTGKHEPAASLSDKSPLSTG